MTINKFRSDMDGAFLVHRGLILPDDDAFDQIPELLAEEALAVMCDSQIDPKKAKKIADEIIDAMDIPNAWTVKPGRAQSQAGVLQKKMLKEGQEKIRKDFDIDVSALAELHAKIDRKAASTEHRLAALYNTRTQYGTRKDLSFGTVVRRKIEENNEYFICLMPLCDSIRLSNKNNKVHRFPFWKLRADNFKQSSKGMAIELPSDEGFIQLFSMGKPRDQMTMQGFKASPSKTVSATKKDGRFIYVDEDSIEFEWVAQLKPNHAQRIAHDISMSLSRVGVIEAEWLRLKAERQ